MAKKSNQGNQPRQNVPPRQPVQPRPNVAPQKQEPKEKKPMSMTTKLAILLAVIAMLVYSNTLLNGYVLDDVMVIKDNFVVPQGMKMIPDILGTLRLKGYANMSNEYRPMSLVMFATECELSTMFTATKTPFTPWLHHFANLLVFGGCVAGLFIFLNKLFDRKKMAVAFIAALLFAVHPIHTEVVANIKSRDELLCFFFAFVSLNMFANYMKSAKTMQLLMGTFALFLSFLSKETVITFLAIVPLIFFFFIDDNRTRAIRITVGTFIATGLYLAIRARIVADNGNMEFPINFVDNMLVKETISASSRLATEIWILGDYIRLLFVPYPLAIDRSYKTIDYMTFANFRVILSLLVYLGLAVFAVMRLIKNKKDPWAFSILFFLATISLFSNIFIMLASTFAERFLFFCSVGSCLAIALAIEKWVIRKDNAAFEDIKLPKVMVVVAILCLPFAVETFARNRDWKDSYTLYSADAAKMPNNTRLNYYVASELQKKCGAETDTVKAKMYNDESFKFLNRSLAIFYDNVDAQAEIGAAFFRAKKYDSAAYHLKYALKINPQKSNALANLGTLYLTLVDYPNALTYYRMTNLYDPRNVVAQFNGGVCYYQMKKPDSAILNFKHTIELQPDFYGYKSFQFIAIIYKELGNMNEARNYEQQAKQFDPNFHL